MLDHLRRRIIETIADVPEATLATFGPADLQASIVRCEASQTHLFVLVPRASDHLFNLESNSQVVITASGWEMRGAAQVVPRDAPHPELALSRAPEAGWCALVEVIPTRIQINAGSKNGWPETIDMRGGD
jgi:hypothetical protein